MIRKRAAGMQEILPAGQITDGTDVLTGGACTVRKRKPVEMKMQ